MQPNTEPHSNPFQPSPIPSPSPLLPPSSSSQISQSQIFSTFSNYGYQPQSMISYEQLKQIFDKEHKRSMGKVVSQTLVKQIWEEGQADSKGQISVSTIAKIVQEAERILGERIGQLRGGRIEGIKRDMEGKNQEIKGYIDYGGDQRGRVNQLTKQYMNMKFELKQYESDLAAFQEDYNSLHSIFSNQNFHLKSYNAVESKFVSNPFPASNIPVPLAPSLGQSLGKSSYAQPHSYSKIYLPPQTTKYQKSSKMLVIFHLNNLCLILELFIMSGLRFSMFPLLSYFHVLLYLFFSLSAISLPPFAPLLASFLFDIAFSIIKMLQKYAIVPQFVGSIERYGIWYFILLWIFMLATLVLRIGMIGLLILLWRQIKNGGKKFFQIMGVRLPVENVTLGGNKFGYDMNKSQYIQNPNIHLISNYHEPEPLNPQQKFYQIPQFQKNDSNPAYPAFNLNSPFYQPNPIQSNIVSSPNNFNPNSNPNPQKYHLPTILNPYQYVQGERKIMKDLSL